MKKHTLYIVIIIILSFLFISCDFDENRKKQTIDNLEKLNNFSYDINNPDTIYYLPKYLDEISGISWYKNNRIVCIQDEKANIYFFDTENGEIISKFDFGKDNDYEDIAVVGKDAYVLRSDGTLFFVENFEKEQRKAKKIKTFLGAKNNTEGLCYDKSNNSLLLACKDLPSVDDEKLYDGYKSIYKFDIEKNKLIEKPLYLIDVSKTDSLKKTRLIGDFFTKGAKKLKLTNDVSKFYPSGIAINPVENGNIYVISSIGKLLIVMNKKGVITNIIELDKRLFFQPEGICFSENGDMYISNEGKNGTATILKFKNISDQNKFSEKIKKFTRLK